MNTKNRYSSQQRQRHVQAWLHGGLSKVAYAQQHGLHIKTFSNWTRLKPEISTDAGAFFPTRLVTADLAPSCDMATLNLPAGCSVTACSAVLVDIIRGLELC